MYIYKITNLLNNMPYIGLCTNSVDKSKNYFGSGVLIREAIKLYGKINFKKEIIELCGALDELQEREKYWIAFYNSIQNGYNISLGGAYNYNWFANHPRKTRYAKKLEIN